MRKIDSFFYSICIIVFIVSCDPVEDRKFTIDNNRKNTISYYLTSDSTENDASDFFANFFYTDADKKIMKDFDYVASQETRKLPMMTTWEKYINQQFKNGVAYMYVIDSINIGRSKEDVVSQKLVTKYRITVDSMRKVNWVLNVK